jgi:hypothetical protein
MGLLVGLGCVVFFDRIFHYAFPILAARLPFEVSVKRASLHTSGVTLENVRVRSRGDQHLASIDKVEVGVHFLTGWWNGHPWQTLGDVRLVKPAVTLEFDREGRINWGTSASSGSSPGSQGASFWNDYSGHLRVVDGFLHFRDERAGGFLYELHQLNGQAAFVPKQAVRLRVTGSTTDSGDPQQVQLVGSVDPLHPSVDLHLATHGLGLADLARYPLIQEEAAVQAGSVDLDLSLRGSSELWTQLAAHLHLQGRLDLKGVAAGVGPQGIPVSDFSGRIRLVAGALQLAHFRGKLFQSPLELEGTIQLPDSQSPPWLELSARVPSFDLRQLTHYQKTLAGFVTVQGHLEGTPNNLRSSASFQGRDLRYLGRRIKKAWARFELDSGALHVLDSYASVSGTDRLSARGWVFMDKPHTLWLKLHGHQPRLTEWIPGAHFGNSQLGTDFDVSVSGNLAKPIVFGSASLAGAPSNPLGLQSGSGRILADSRSLFFWGGQLQGAERHIDVPWAFLDLQDRFAAAALHSSHVRLPALDISGHPVTGDVTGNLVGWGSLDHLDQLRAVAQVSDGELRVPRFEPITSLHGNLWWAGGMAGIPDVTGQWNGGQLSVTGTARPQARAFDLYFAGSELPLDGLARNPWLNLPLQPHERGEVVASWDASPKASSFAISSKSPGGRVGALGMRIGPKNFGVYAMADHFPAAALDLNGVVLPGRLTGELATEPTGPDTINYWMDGLLTQVRPGAPDVELSGEGYQRQDSLHLNESLFSWSGSNPVTPAPYLLQGEVSAERPAQVELVPRTSWRYGDWADVTADRGFASVHGGIDSKRGQVGLHFLTRNLDVGWLARTRSERVRSLLLDADGTVAGSLRAPVVQSRLYSPWISLTGASGQPSIFSASGDLRMTRSGLRVAPFWLSARPYDDAAGDQHLRGVAELWFGAGPQSPSRLDATLTSSDFPIYPLRNLLPSAVGQLKVSGQLVTDKFHLHGPLDDLSADGELAIANGGVWSQGRLIPIDEARVGLVSHGKAVKLSHLDFRAGPIKLTGGGGRDRKGRYFADLRSSSVPLAYLHQFGAPFSAFEGNLNWEARVETSPGQGPSLLLSGDSPDLVWTSPEGTPVALRSLRLGTHESPIRLRMQAGKLVVDLPEKTAGAELASGGNLSLSGRLVLGKSPRGNLWAWADSLEGPEFGQGAMPFSATFSGVPWVVVRGGLGLPADQRSGSFGGHLELHGKLAALARPTGRSASLPSLALALDEFSLEGPGSGGQSGVRLKDPFRADLSASEPGSLWLHVGAANLEFFHRSAISEVVEGTLGGSADLEVARSGLRKRSSRAQHLDLGARGVALRDLGFLFPTVQPLSGLLRRLEFSAHDPLPDTRAQLSVDLGPSSIGTLNLAGAAGSVEMSSDKRGLLRLGFSGPNHKDQMLVYFGQQESEQQLLRLQGQMGLALVPKAPASNGVTPVWELWSLSRQSTLGISADVKDQSMSLVQALLPAGTRATGNLQGHLALSGTLQRPQLSGDLELDHGTFTNPKLVTNVTNLEVRTKFEKISPEEARPSALDSQLGGEVRSRYTVEKFDGLLGLQPFAGNGTAELAGMRPTFLDFRLKGKQLPLGVQGLFSGRADVDLGLHTRLGQLPGMGSAQIIPVLDGSVRVPVGDMQVPLASLSSSAGSGSSTSGLQPPPFLYDVDLYLGDNVWVNALGSRVRTEGQLKILPSATTHEPVLAGSVYLSRGLIHIPLYEMSFLVRQGYAYFDHSLMPRLQNVVADTTFGAYQITARVDGQYPDLHVDMVSNPPLPNTDLQRMVSLGTTASSGGNAGLSGVPTSQLDQQQSAVGSTGLLLLSNLLTAPLTQGLGKLFFLSEVGFDIQPPYDYVIKLAKALDDKDKVLITLIQVVSSGNRISTSSSSQYGIEYRFQPNLLTRVSYGNNGQYMLWFQGVVRFWGL